MLSARQRPLPIHRPVTTAWFAAWFGLALLISVLLGGCGSGQQTQTSNQQSAVDGASGQLGPIAVRNAHLVFPGGGEHFYRPGADAPLALTIANTGATDDELLSMTSPAAQSVRIDGPRTVPAQRTLRAVAMAGAPEKATGKAAGKDAAQATGARLAGQVSIVMEGLNEELRPGKTAPVTFLFRQAGTLTINLPIGPSLEPRSAE